MQAIILNKPGGIDELLYQELPLPALSPTDVLVKVKALSINPVDVKTRAGFGVYGRLKTEQPLIIGWDIAGIVDKVGNQVTQFNPGDEVFGMVNFPGHGRAYAQYVAAPAAHLAIKPANISFEEAAASTLAALTAWQALTKQYTVRKGDKVLIHAAAGGVGHFAVQLAKHLGAHVTGTSSAANKDFILGLGADAHIDYRTQRFEEVITDADFVLDAIGKDNVDRSLDAARRGGTVISIPSGLNEQITEKAKSKGVNGFFFLVQSNGEDMHALAELLKNGHIKAHVGKVFPFAGMGQAHALQETGRAVGKIVVRIEE